MPSHQTLIQRAAELHRRIIAFDSHIDIPLEFGQVGRGPLDDGPDAFDLVKAARGGLSGAALSVHATLSRPSPASAAAGRAEHEKRHAALSAIALDHPDRAEIVRTPDELRVAASHGRFGIMLSLQNTEPLPDLDALNRWRDRGVRMVGYNFIGNNRWSDSARPYPFIGQGLHSNGLSPLGLAGVERLNDLGIIVDVSQISSDALASVLKTSRLPVVASHSAPRAMVDIDRNLTDVEMRLIAVSGGVIGVVGFGPYIVPISEGMQAELAQTWARFGLRAPTRMADFMSVNDPATAGWDEDRFWDFLHEFHVVLDLDKPVATIKDYVDAIDHTISTVGIDHVGIGSDFNHASGVVGWMDVGGNLNLTAELIRRGYSDTDIEKLWGSNFLRVWQQVLDGARI